ncbi:response regulator [Christiangramia fulva]|uniref:Response regulator n=1 Tax=Christiangramia fulva TaxID=2126553 RepID=A0A2R3Z2G1_9FLAO|nr:response regulator [Christiangramia fulva]AVR44447.1 response regulator [Christiangramia fulva]
MEEKEINEVLVIEDDKIFATVHTHMVRKTLGVDPQIFEKATDAVGFLDKRRKKGGYSLILLDLNMPGMNGWEFLDVISQKEYYREMLVVIVTSSMFCEDYRRSQNYKQVIAYHTKPFKREQLSEMIKNNNLEVKKAVT